MMLADLPPELIIYILSYLPALSITACATTNRTLHAVISSSVHLQYTIALHKACAEDNPHSSLSYSEKLELLRRKEKAWSNLTPDFHRVVPLSFSPGSVYDLSGDTYLLGDDTRKRLLYLRLPRQPTEVPQWKKFACDDNRHIVDFGLNLYEHDLIAVVTAELVPNQNLIAPPLLAIELNLRKFTTGAFHPLGKMPSIPVMTTELRWGSPSINLEIVGRYLALVTTIWRNPSARCIVTVYEWQTGKVVLKIDGEPDSYSGVVFLREDILLLPNTETRALELWKIPDPKDESSTKSSSSASGTQETPPLRPILRLALPQLSPQNILRYISCRAEPNPVGVGSHHGETNSNSSSTSSPTPSTLPYSTRPFHNNPLDAVVLLHLRITNITNANSPSFFTIFVHRRSLLDLLPRDGRGFGADADSGSGRREVAGLAAVDSDMNTDILEYDEEDEVDTHFNTNTNPNTNPSSTSTTSTDLHSIRIPWSAWGPLITFCMDLGGDMPSRWITTTCGQRFVILAGAPEEEEAELVGAEVEAPSSSSSSAHQDNDNEDDEEDEEQSTIVNHVPSTSSILTSTAIATSSVANSHSHSSNVNANIEDEDEDMDGEESSSSSSYHSSDSGDEEDEEEEEGDGPPKRSIIVVFDFNRYNVRKAERELQEAEAEEDEHVGDEDDGEDEKKEYKGQNVTNGAAEKGKAKAKEQAKKGRRRVLDKGKAVRVVSTERRVIPMTSTSPNGNGAPNQNQNQTQNPGGLPQPHLGPMAIDPLAGTFVEDIVSCLPYVVTATKTRYALDGVLMDDEGVIGLKTDVEGHIQSVEVLHMG